MAEETVLWPEEYMVVATQKVCFNSTTSTAASLWAAALRGNLVITAPTGGRAWIPGDDDSGGYLARDYAQYVNGFKGKLTVVDIKSIRLKQMERIRAIQEKIKADQGANEIKSNSLIQEAESSSSASKTISKRAKKMARKQVVTEKPVPEPMERGHEVKVPDDGSVHPDDGGDQPTL